MRQVKFYLIKVLMLCLGLEPGAAGWKAQTNPLSFGGKMYAYGRSETMLVGTHDKTIGTILIPTMSVVLFI